MAVQTVDLSVAPKDVRMVEQTAAKMADCSAVQTAGQWAVRLVVRTVGTTGN